MGRLHRFEQQKSLLLAQEQLVDREEIDHPYGIGKAILSQDGIHNPWLLERTDCRLVVPRHILPVGALMIRLA